MASSVKRIVELVVKGDTAGAKQSLDGLVKGMTGLSGGALGVAAAAAVAAAAVIKGFTEAARALGNTVDEIAEIGDEFDKLTLRTNLSVEALSEFSYITQRQGGDIGQVERGLQAMVRSMRDVTEGTATASRAWNELGVSVTNQDGSLRDITEVLYDVRSAFAGMENETAAQALAMEIFGRAGKELIPVLRLTDAEFNAQAETVRRLGGVYSKEFATAGADYGDAVLNMNVAMTGLKIAFGEAFTPAFTEVINQIAESVAGLGKTIGANKEGIASFASDLADITVFLTKMAGAGAEFNVKFGPAIIEAFSALDPKFGAFISQMGIVRTVVKAVADDTRTAGKEIAGGFQFLQGPQVQIGPFDQGQDARDKLRELAASLNLSVTIPTVLDDGTWAAVEKDAETLQSDIAARITEILNKPIEAAPVVEIDHSFAGFDQQEADGEFQTLEDLLELDKERNREKAIEAAFGRSIEEGRALQRQFWQDEQDAIEARRQREAALNEELAKRKDIADANAEAERLVGDVARDAGLRLQDMSAQAVSAFVQGQGQAVMFGRALRTIVADALSEIIVKLLVIKAIKAFGGLFASGGEVPGAAFGMQVPRAAAGMVVPYSTQPGMDSALIAAMPGEGVIRRDTMMRLERFLAASENAAAVSPDAIRGGSGVNQVINYNVARPLTWRDHLDLGMTAAAAQRDAARSVI